MFVQRAVAVRVASMPSMRATPNARGCACGLHVHPAHTADPMIARAHNARASGLHAVVRRHCQPGAVSRQRHGCAPHAQHKCDAHIASSVHVFAHAACTLAAALWWNAMSVVLLQNMNRILGLPNKKHAPTEAGFAAFLQRLKARRSRGGLDGHFMPMTQLGGARHFDYEYRLKLEELTSWLPCMSEVRAHMLRHACFRPGGLHVAAWPPLLDRAA